MNRKLICAGIIAAGAAALGGAASATPGGGVISAAVVARAAFAEPVDMKFKVGGNPTDVLHVENAKDTVMQQITIAPGGTTGWHSHPGPVVVLIASGTMSFYGSEDPSCTATTYSTGQAFIDSGQGHVHIARNEGTENLVLWATYFDVPPGQPFRIDAPNPGNCPF
jgi:quercetin dioxygenase-like cupin family protein